MARISNEFYGQNGEDYLLWRLFQGRKSGFFVDVGAFDGVHLSNSYYFEQQGWDGICIEPHPRYFHDCEINRPGSKCINSACVGMQMGSESIEFHADVIGLLSSLNTPKTPPLTDLYSSRVNIAAGRQQVLVSAATLSEILDTHAPGRRYVDFISIDATGAEIDILNNFDFNTYHIRCFVVEAPDDNTAQEIVKIMQAKSLLLARVLGKSLFFCSDISDYFLLKYTRIRCQIADTLHPMGQEVTLNEFRARKIADNERWLTENVLCQEPDQPFFTLVDYFVRYDEPNTNSPKFFHIVNLFDTPDDAHRATQDKTVRSMLEAKAFTEEDVTHVSVIYEEDSHMLPESFIRADDLSRSVGEIFNFERERKLPLLYDILERGAQIAGPEDYLIYTNSDICLRPYFYNMIAELIRAGFDAITVNRRTIGDLDLYSEFSNLAILELGSAHPGFDCLIFKRSNFEKYIRNDACVGMGWVMRGLLYNMVAHSSRMIMLKNVDLTYHFGDDQNWDNGEYSDYIRFNEQEYARTLQKLCADETVKHLLHQFCKKHGEKFVPLIY